MVQKCVRCGREFMLLSSLRNHEKSCGKDPHKCPNPSCNYQSVREWNVTQHVKTCPYNPARLQETGAQQSPTPALQNDIQINQRKRAAPEENNNLQISRNQPPIKKKPTDHATSFNTIQDFADPEQVPYPEMIQYYQARLLKNNLHVLRNRHVDVQFTFSDNLSDLEPNEQNYFLLFFFENVMHIFLRKLPKYDFVRFTVQCPLFHKAISKKFVTVEMASVDMLLDAVVHVLNSIEEFSLDSGLTIHFQHQQTVIPASGRNTHGRPSGRKVWYKQDYFNVKQSVIVIKNKDQLCVARCLMIGKKKADKTYNHCYFKSAKLTRDAQDLHSICDIPKGPCGLPEIQKFAAHEYFQDYMINVFDYQLQCERIFKSEPKEKTISLLLDDGHCHVITKPAGFFGSKYWCKLCNGRYDHEPHKCEQSCPMCKRPKCPNKVREKWNPAFMCGQCMAQFTLQECMDTHKSIEACKGKRRCKKCYRLLPEKNFSEDNSH